MPVIDPVPTENWSAPFVLDRNEAWSCEEGTVRVTADANPGKNDGRLLQEGDAWPFPSGTAVRCRALSDNSRISREPIA